MTDSSFALVVSILTLGGLIGALSAPFFSDHYGRRLTLFGTNVLLGAGSLWATLSSTWTDMMIGRFLSGLGIGVVVVVVPAYIAECVPPARRGLFGAMNQLCVVIGIMVAQVLGLFWSTLTRWRWILAVGFLLALAESILLPFCVDSPRYLAAIPGGFNRAKDALMKLRKGTVDQVEDEIIEWRRDWATNQQAVVDEEEEEGLHRAVAPTESNHVNIWRFMTNKEYRRPLSIVLLVQLCQQLSGINAVIYYSTSIMSHLFPESSSMMTVYISIVNLIVTGISAVLMDKAGRRTLFLISASCMASMSVLLGWGMNHGQDTVSALAILGFVAAFAIGLGPIPFLMIPEIVETQAVSSACSVGLASNMITNFIISVGYPILSQILGAGNVFYIFGACLIVFVGIAVMILPETKGRSPEDVIRSGYSIYPCHYEQLHT